MTCTTIVLCSTTTIICFSHIHVLIQCLGKRKILPHPHQPTKILNFYNLSSFPRPPLRRILFWRHGMIFFKKFYCWNWWLRRRANIIEDFLVPYTMSYIRPSAPWCFATIKLGNGNPSVKNQISITKDLNLLLPNFI